MRLNQQWVLKQRPKDHDVDVSPRLELVSTPIPALREGEILTKHLYLSLDPTNRIWMSEREQYLPPVKIGEVMRGVTIGVVEDSQSSRFQCGDLVLHANGGWQLYSISPAGEASRLRPAGGASLSSYLSVLGATGLTAYFGLLDICQPKPGETLVVSAAAGAVGSIVGQIGKIQGCRVVGIAGGPKKCQWLLEELGFDAAIDYRNNDLENALTRACPNGVDMQFENVGGSIMDSVFSRLNQNGRMALCGMISAYNQEGPFHGPKDFGRVLMNRLTVRGFIVLDYIPRAREALESLSAWVAEGRIKWKEHVVDGLENAPAALQRLFDGSNDGKLMIRLASHA
jgi:NADPH-dependent curcumin reductase